MERVVRGRSFTLSKTFYSDGVAASPTGTPTVTLVRQSDGSAVTSSSVAGTGVGPYTVTVTAANNLLLDTLTVTWTATIGGQANTYVDTVEVAGDALFSIAEARALKPLDNLTNYTTAAIVEIRTAVEQALEDACGVAFVPRYRQETVDGTGTANLLLAVPRIRRIRSVSVSSTAWSQATVDAVTYRPGGLVYSTTPWTAGYGNLTVGYEHGYDTPPERVRRAALLLARTWLVTGPVDDRASTFTSDNGASYSLVTPGRGGSVFGIPEVDVVVQEYGMVTGVA